MCIRDSYSYIWAEVLDCDAYEAYKETGDIFNQEVAGKFRKYILTPGCIDDAMDMYVTVSYTHLATMTVI